MRTDCRSEGYNTEVGVNFECDVRPLADDVSSIADIQGTLPRLKQRHTVREVL